MTSLPCEWIKSEEEAETDSLATEMNRRWPQFHYTDEWSSFGSCADMSVRPPTSTLDRYDPVWSVAPWASWMKWNATAKKVVEWAVQQVWKCLVLKRRFCVFFPPAPWYVSNRTLWGTLSQENNQWCSSIWSGVVKYTLKLITTSCTATIVNSFIKKKKNTHHGYSYI